MKINIWWGRKKQANMENFSERKKSAVCVQCVNEDLTKKIRKIEMKRFASDRI